MINRPTIPRWRRGRGRGVSAPDLPVLHLTSSAAAARRLRDAGMPGEVLAWRDVLYEGPLPGGVTQDQLSEERAAYLAGQRWAEPTHILGDIRVRDEKIRSAAADHEFVLWFSQTMGEQLQLVQIANLIHTDFGAAERTRIVPVPPSTSQGRLRSVGALKSRTIRRLYARRRPVSDAEIETFALAWAALRADDPTELNDLVRTRQLERIPQLANAIDRFLGELPSAENGLSDLEELILTLILDEPKLFRDVLNDVMIAETEFFPGDADLWSRVLELAGGSSPVLEVDWDEPACASVSITDTGKAALRREVDVIELNDIERWFGGTHLRSPDNDWRRTSVGVTRRSSA